MASIAQVTTSEKTYPADLMLSVHSGSIILTFGADAEAVDTVEGMMLLDPSEGVVLESVPGIHIREDEAGVYTFVMDIGQRSIKKGEELVRIPINTAEIQHIALTDTEFTSGIHRYHLSNIVQ